MSDNEKLLQHARNLVGLLESHSPSGQPWLWLFNRALEGIFRECGLQLPVPAPDTQIDQAACPHCGAQPLRFNIQQGPVPMGEAQLLIAQAWCSACKRQLAMQIMGVIPAEPNPASDIGAGNRKKLWSPC